MNAHEMNDNFNSSTMFHCSLVDGPLWPPPHKHRGCGATRYLFMIQIRQSNNREVSWLSRVWKIDRVRQNALAADCASVAEMRRHTMSQPSRGARATGFARPKQTPVVSRERENAAGFSWGAGGCDTQYGEYTSGWKLHVDRWKRT